MVLQRHIFQVTKQYLARTCLVKSKLKTPTYCQIYHQYSTDKSRRFTDRHEWITVADDIGTVGISQYAQESLGDVVFAQLPDIGTEFKAGDECGALESVKAASEIYTPLSGKVIEKNKNVEEKPGLINTSCYEQGWLFRLKISKPDEIKDLMDEEKYEVFLKTDADKEHT